MTPLKLLGMCEFEPLVDVVADSSRRTRTGHVDFEEVGDVLVVDVLEKSLACSNVSQSRPEPRGLAAKSSREHVEESPMPPMPTGRRTRV